MIYAIKIDNKYGSESWFLTPKGLHVYRKNNTKCSIDPEGVTGKLRNVLIVIILTCDSSSQKS